jgi:hypothetical protein
MDRQTRDRQLLETGTEIRIWLHGVNSAVEVPYNCSRELPLIRTNIQNYRSGSNEGR